MEGRSHGGCVHSWSKAATSPGLPKPASTKEGGERKTLQGSEGLTLWHLDSNTGLQM